MTTINGRTPEEIKKAVECCANPDMRACRSCPYDNESCCKKNVDTLAYIQQLEERVVDLNKTSKQLERERDALLNDFKNYQNRQFDAHKGPYACDLCKWGNFYGYGGNCKCPDSATCIRMEKWEWRGVQEVE